MDTQSYNTDTPSKLPIGCLIGERYRVKSYLGSGAFGTVYQCTDMTLGTLSVAVKIFPKWVSTDKKRAKRIHRELRACYRVNHDNVVRFYDTIHDENALGYSMEYVNGSPLDKLVEPYGIGDFSLIASFLRQLLFGVQSIHEAGIIHRDLKPENIIVSKDFILKVADFGLVSSLMEASDTYFSTTDKSINDAIETVRTTGSGHIVGTPAYMAPETVKNRSYDKRSDLYSVGVIAYELITGQIPFETLSCNQLLLAKVESEPPKVESLRTDCPKELSEFVNKLLAKDPDRRFQNSKEALDALSICQKKNEILELQSQKPFNKDFVIQSNFDDIFHNSDRYTTSFIYDFIKFFGDFNIHFEWWAFFILALFILIGAFKSSEPDSVSEVKIQQEELAKEDNVKKSRFFGPQSSKNNVIVVRPE